MTKIFFTSDTHFGHKSVLKWCDQTRMGHSCIDEHDELLIQQWNTQVGKRDHVYHLGDFSFAVAARTEEILGRLNGYKHLIYGNHDQLLRQQRFFKYFESRQDYKEIKVSGQKVVMLHFPMWEWNACHHGSYHLFGHVHANYFTVRGRSMNVGIDARPAGDMRLWEYEEVHEFLKDREVITHHRRKNGDV